MVKHYIYNVDVVVVAKIVNIKNILLSCVSCLVLTGCYTQLAMFYPEPEIEEDVEEQFYETYSRAVPRPLNLSIYAQDGAGTPLSLAYSSMYNRFQPYYGFGYGYGRDGYYNSYGTYYGYDSYLLGGYRMYVPTTDLYVYGERKPRTFSTDRSNTSHQTNLTTTRTRTESSTNSNTSDSGYSNSSNVSSTRSSSGSSSSSSSSSGGRRVTRRH